MTIARDGEIIVLNLVLSQQVSGRICLQLWQSDKHQQSSLIDKEHPQTNLHVLFLNLLCPFQPPFLPHIIPPETNLHVFFLNLLRPFQPPFLPHNVHLHANLHVLFLKHSINCSSLRHKAKLHFTNSHCSTTPFAPCSRSFTAL